MSKVISSKYNNNWGHNTNPFITIITPVYNRRNTIQRAIRSVEQQVFRNIEYIIIDDGSTISSDDIIERYMSESDLPVAYIKKENGGVHTARNVGYDYARGEMIICLDSDDELTADACELFYRAWNDIPKEIRTEFWQIKALCVDEKGNLSGNRFPENINIFSHNEANKYFSGGEGEQLGCRLTSILKDNKFPEPPDIKFVNEVILWLPLEMKYRSWGTNDIVRIYHTEGNDHLTGGKGQKSIQSCLNALWNSAYELNHASVYIKSKKRHASILLRYCIMEQILRIKKKDFSKDFKIKNIKDNIGRILLMAPSIIGAYVYINKRM